MIRIVGALQHYPWGHDTALARLRGVEPSGRPEAEYWLGAHPRGPARQAEAPDDDGPTLDAVIAAEPDMWLGPAVSARFGELPFLFKLLAADQPLSIQAHPDPDQARAGFERENQAGIDRDDFKRSYRDPNHKPELICALSTFEAKCGFRPLEATRRLISLFEHPALEPLRCRLLVDDEPKSVLRAVTSWLLDLDQRAAADLVRAAVADAERMLADPEAEEAITGFRSDLEWTVRIDGFHPDDVGVVVALLMNHITLAPGQALFLEAGVLHAYLGGLGVELMANSDNVLRCGLTVKHVDVDELLSVATFEPGLLPVQTMAGSAHRFDSPVPEFALTGYRHIPGDEQHRCEVAGPEIVLVESGSAVLTVTVEGTDGDRWETLRLGPGEAVAVPAATGRYQLLLEGAGTTVWRASVGR